MFNKVMRNAFAFPRPVRELAQSLGFRNALLYGIHRTLQTLHPSCSLKSYYIVAQPVSPQPLLPGSRGASVAVRFADPGDVVLGLMGRSPEEIAARFASPGVCIVAEKNERMVGFLWLLLGRYREPDDHCTFIIDSPHAAWDLDVFVEPALRLSPVFARLWSEANLWLRARGIEWTLSRISCYNERSLQSHARLGSIKLGRMTFLKLGPLQTMFSSVPPYVHGNIGNGAGPVIRLQPPSN
jgi:hypothetical protein